MSCALLDNAPPNSAFSVGAPTSKQGKCITLAIFAAPLGLQKCLLGLLPKPATSGQNVHK